jgi:hypothetical protein
LAFSGVIKRGYHLGDLALVRPGRCYARIQIRALTGPEAKALARHLAAGDADKLARAAHTFAADDDKRRSLAEVYQALRPG